MESMKGARDLLIDNVFPELRKEGIICRANFQCCMNCGYSYLNDMVKERLDKGKDVIGVTFWHRQDEENYWYPGISGKQSLHLCFSNADIEGHTSDISTQRVGFIIKHACERHGLTVKWDGTPETRIEVYNEW